MALEGNISEFSLPEILQLLSSQRKTGVLQLEQEGDTAAFDFDEGKITGGFYHKKNLPQHLGNYLFKTGLITESALAQAEAEHKKLAIPLEEVLIEKGFISEEDFTEVIRFKIQEIMDEVFTWVEGHYIFDLKTRLYANSKYPIKLDTDGFLLEGMRRLDEWLRIRTVIPDLDTLISTNPGYQKKENQNLSGEQKKIIEFLGHRHLSVSNLVDISGLGKFLTCQTVAELKEMDVITILQAPPVHQAAAVQDFSAREQMSVISLMIKHLGSLVRRISIYPFNHAKVLSAIEEFFYLFNGLGLTDNGLVIVPGLDCVKVNDQEIESSFEIINHFGLYLIQRQIEKLELLPQLKGDECRNFAYLLALPSDLIRMLNGLDSLARDYHLRHIRMEYTRQCLEPLMQNEKSFVIPSRFMDLLDDQDDESTQQKNSLHLFNSLRGIIRLPEPKLPPGDHIKLEEADNSAEKAFTVYSRGGREKYIEKIVQLLMDLPPAPRLAFLKRKVSDLRWLFPLDNAMVLSQEQFQKPWKPR